MLAGVQVASLYAKISADSTAFRNEANKVKSELNVMQRGFNDFGNVAADLGRKAAVAVAAVGVALTGVGVVIAKTGIEFNGMKEQALVAFTTMLGSGERAKAFLDDLQKFAAATPFEFPDLVRASQRLLAMGFAANEVKPLLTAVGDAVAALGGSSEMVDRVTLALGQMQAKGKVSAEEMLQLTEAGIPAWEILAKKIGVSIPEAMAMATKGAISADTAIAAMVEGMNSRFGGMMEQQSQTFNGLISTIKDNFAMLSGVVMEPFFLLMKDGLKSIATLTGDPAFVAGVQKFAAQLALWMERGIAIMRDVLPKLWDAVRQGFEVVQTIVGHILAFGDAVRLLMEPVVGMIGKVVTWKDALTALALILSTHIVIAIAGFIAALTPVIALVAAVAAAVAALRWAWTNDFLNIRSITEKTLDRLKVQFKDKFASMENAWKGTTTFMLGDTKVTVPLIVGNFIGLLKYWAHMGVEHVKGFVRDWKAKITEWATDVGYKIGDFVNETTNQFKHWSGGIIGVVNDWFTKQKATFDNWKYYLSTWIDGSNLQFQAWKEKWLGWFNPSEWAQDGRDWIQGLWNGVTEKWNQFVNWWRDRWQDLKDGWNRFWGIHSPSTVFHESGLDMMSGLEKGIDDGWKTKVQPAVKKLNAALSEGLIKGYTVFEDMSYRVQQLSGAITSGIIKNNQLLQTDVQLPGGAPVGTGTPTKENMQKTAEAMWPYMMKAFEKMYSGEVGVNPLVWQQGIAKELGYTGSFDSVEWNNRLEKYLRDKETKPLSWDAGRSFSQSISTFTQTSSDVVNTWLDRFVGDFMGAVSAPGQAQFSSAGEAAIATQYVRNSEAVNVSAGKIIGQLGILIEELRSRGLGNQFNLSMAPTRTGDTTTDLRSVVEYLQLLYA